MWLTNENTSLNVQVKANTNMTTHTKLTWKKDEENNYYNDFYAIEKRNGSWRVFDRLGRRVVTTATRTLKLAKYIAQLDLDATNLNER